MDKCRKIKSSFGDFFNFNFRHFFFLFFFFDRLQIPKQLYVETFPYSNSFAYLYKISGVSLLTKIAFRFYFLHMCLLSLFHPSLKVFCSMRSHYPLVSHNCHTRRTTKLKRKGIRVGPRFKGPVGTSQVVSSLTQLSRKRWRWPTMR